MTRAIQVSEPTVGRPLATGGVVLALAEGVRARWEYFGALAWRLGARELADVRGVHAEVLMAAAEGMAVSLAADAELAGVVRDLTDRGLVTTSRWPGPAVSLREVLPHLRPTVADGAGGVAKPLWVHLQPFTRCNQECVHCYCFGARTADGFQLPEVVWHLIVQRLARYGVRDIYITGGETLLYPAVFGLVELVLDLGLTCGLSTNAMAVGPKTVDRLRSLRLSAVQVSLDGGTAATNDMLRGTPGAFAKTVAGIERLAEFTEPVLNTVVTPENLDELELIVEVGQGVGCSRYKFFPEKITGRGAGARRPLDDEELARLAATCARLRAAGVEVESLDNTAGCGSADTGFAVDQHGDVYPCIFGIADDRQRAGSLLEASIDELWFDSPVFRAFRAQCSRPCHRCELVSCS